MWFLAISKNVFAGTTFLGQSDDGWIGEKIESRKAFFKWQTYWKELEPEFAIKNFELKKKEDFNLRKVRDISFDDLQKNKLLMHSFFSPNGKKAVNPFVTNIEPYEGKIYFVGDDYHEIRLFDFQQMVSLRLYSLQHYGPQIHGLAWLSDDTLILIASDYKETDNWTQFRSPLIVIFDFKNQEMREWIGKYVPISLYSKMKNWGFIVETLLMFYKASSVHIR